MASGDQVAVTYRSGEPPEGMLGVRVRRHRPGVGRRRVHRDRGSTTARSRCWSPTPASPSDTLLLRMGDEDWSDVIDTNLTGSFRVAKRAAKGMLRLRRGRIIFISSVVGAARLRRPGQLRRQQGRPRRHGPLAGPRARQPLDHRERRRARLRRDRHDRRAPRGDRRRSTRSRSRSAATPPPTEVASVGHLARLRRRRATSPGRSSRSTAASAWATDRLTTTGHHLSQTQTTEGVRRHGHSRGQADPGRRASRWTPRSASRSHGSRRSRARTVLVSNFGRALGITKRIVGRLPEPAPVLELDVTDPEHLERLPDLVREHVDGLDGVVHSIAYGNPETLLGGKFLEGPWEDVAQAVQVSAYSLKSLSHGVPAADEPGRLGRRDDLRRDGRLAGVRLDGRGQGRAGVLLALPRPRPRPEGRPGQPGVRRSAEDAGREGDPGLRGARVDVERPLAAGLGREGPRADRARRSSPCSATSSRRPPARSCTSTAATTRWAPERRRRGSVRAR